MLIYVWEIDNQRTYATSCKPSQSVLLFTSGIWGSFYAILLQRVIKEGGKMKEIKDNGDEKKLLGIYSLAFIQHFLPLSLLLLLPVCGGDVFNCFFLCNRTTVLVR